MDKKAIDRALLQQVAELSKLSIPAEEEAVYLRDLEEMISYVGQVERLVFSPDVEDDACGETVWREEERLTADDRISPAHLLEEASLRKEGYFMVPKTVE